MWGYVIVFIIGVVLGGVAGMLFGKRNKGIVDSIDSTYKDTTDKIETKIKG